MAVSAPPKRNKDVAAPTTAPTPSEKKIEEIISRGSSTVVTTAPQADADTVKNVTIKILADRLKVIEELREKRPRKPTSPKLGISQVDWIVEAIEEKIKRERKQYNIN